MKWREKSEKKRERDKVVWSEKRNSVRQFENWLTNCLSTKNQKNERKSRDKQINE